MLTPEGKRIEVVTMKVGDLKKGFGNPRKIKKAKREDLVESLETFGDFGLFLIDEHDNIIGGNQRAAILNEMNPDTEITCKRLIGYTESELKSINVRDNTHNGEWDVDILADWFQDMSIDLVDQEPDPKDRVIQEMMPIAFEKYNYVLVVCKNELDYTDLQKKLGLTDAKVVINEKKKLQARAVWYDPEKWS